MENHPLHKRRRSILSVPIRLLHHGKNLHSSNTNNTNSSINNGLSSSSSSSQGSSGFDDLRRYVKQGNEFCKEVVLIVQERSEASMAYSKILLKLGGRLKKANANGIGTLADSWTLMATEMENESIQLKNFSCDLQNNIVKPIKAFAEQQHKSRKPIESKIDKATKNLNDCKADELKYKKLCYSSTRERELLCNNLVNSISPLTKGKTTDKDITKQEKKIKSQEVQLCRHDNDYYQSGERTELARYDWLNCIYKNTQILQNIEERRIKKMTDYLDIYNNHISNLAPLSAKASKLISSAISNIDVQSDIIKIIDLKSSSSMPHEQYLLDYLAEDMSFRMDKDRRKDMLNSYCAKISTDIEGVIRNREDAQKILSNAYKNQSIKGDGNDDASAKIEMLDCKMQRLEACKFKMLEKISTIDQLKSPVNKYAQYTEKSVDKQGNTVSILRMPTSSCSSYSANTLASDSCSLYRAPGDGDFVPSSSQSFNETSRQPSAPPSAPSAPPSYRCSVRQSAVSAYDEDEFDDVDHVHDQQTCRAIYDYIPKQADELALKEGDIISIFKKQENDWWKGEVNGRIGIFPSNYVEPL